MRSARTKIMGFGSAILMASALFLASAPAMAATTSATSTATNATTITSGGFSLTNSLSDFSNGGTPASPEAMTDTQTITNNPTGIDQIEINGTGSGVDVVNATDDTGSLAGWTLTVQATPLTEVAPSAGFASGTSAIVLPEGTLEMAGFSTAVAESSQTSALDPTLEDSGTLEAIDGADPVELVSAPAGTGSGEWGFDYSSSITAWEENFNINSKIVDLTNYPSGSTPYASTLTLTMTQG